MDQTLTIQLADNEPRIANRAIGAIAHACHVATIDQGLSQLAIPDLTRDTLEPVLQYCAEVRCAADQVSCPGCKRRTEALGLETVECVTQREFAGRFVGTEGHPFYAEGGGAEAFRCLVQRPSGRKKPGIS